MRSLLMMILASLVQNGCASKSVTNGFSEKSSASLRSLGSVQENIDERLFNQTIEHAVAGYRELAKLHGAELNIEKNWSDRTPEAHAGKTDAKWTVYIAGGIVRNKPVGPDVLSFTVCHELGHEFAGYPLVNLPGNEWNTQEGETDYYAAYVCARRLWKDKTIPDQATFAAIDPVAVRKCDEVWNKEADRRLCYRIMMAGFETLTSQAEIQQTQAPSFSKVEPSNSMTLQCRLDSIIAGALCTAPYDFNLLPGYKDRDGINSAHAKTKAQRNSCDKMNGSRSGLKPACWWN